MAVETTGNPLSRDLNPDQRQSEFNAHQHAQIATLVGDSRALGEQIRQASLTPEERTNLDAANRDITAKLEALGATLPPTPAT